MGFEKRTIKDVPLDNKTVLVRVDYNVPLNKDGTIRNDMRVRGGLQTIRYLLRKGCKVILVSHLGRPDGKKDPKYTLEPIADHLGTLLKNTPVSFVDDCIGDKVKQAVKRMQKGSVLVLENVRYYPQEEKNSMAFARKMAEATGARYFVQDAFGAVHRAHASTDAIAQFIPGVAGLLVKREYTRITSAMERPKRPLVAVIGGAKVSDKVALIEKFVEKADKIIIGGAMANTFLQYRGYAMQKSLVEPGQEGVLDAIYHAARVKLSADNVDDFIILPVDLAVAKAPDDVSERKEVAVDAIPEGYAAFDVGARSIERIVHEVEGVGTVIWNGTLGYAEVPTFAHGSARLALALASQPDVTSVIGGGDTADFVLSWSGDEGKAFTHISTGGGASLELMAGALLPGIECLLDA